MEKPVDRIIAEFPLSSFCGVYSVIEILFIAVVPDQSLWKNREKAFVNYALNHMLQLVLF